MQTISTSILSLITTATLLVASVIPEISGSEGHAILRDHYHGDSLVHEGLPTFPHFQPHKDTWCRGGRGRIIGGYQSEPVACATICAEEPNCGGFNLRAVDGICAAYTHGCREDANGEWTFYRRIVGGVTAKAVPAVVVESSGDDQATVASLPDIEPELLLTSPATTTTTTTEEVTTPKTSTATSTSTTPTTTTTTTTTTQEPTTLTTEAPTTTTTEEVTSTSTSSSTSTSTFTTTALDNKNEAEAPAAGVAIGGHVNKAAAVGSAKFVDLAAKTDSGSSSGSSIVPMLKGAVFNEYQMLKGNCRGGGILKMFVELSPKQCADACSAHCSCLGFTYADDTEHCVLKETRCEEPIAHHPNVNFYAHIYRHPSSDDDTAMSRL